MWSGNLEIGLEAPVTISRSTEKYLKWIFGLKVLNILSCLRRQAPPFFLKESLIKGILKTGENDCKIICDGKKKS